MKKIYSLILLTALLTIITSCKKEEDEGTIVDDIIETRITVTISLENNSEKEGIRVNLHKDENFIESYQLTDEDGKTTFRGFDAGNYHISGTGQADGLYFFSEDLHFTLDDEEHVNLSLFLLQD